MSIKVKICGLKTRDAVDAAVSGGADYVGFVFYRPSPRNVDPKLASELVKNLPKDIKKVAVVVNASDDELDAIFTHLKPDYLQCHGDESQERIYELRIRYSIPVIKAIAIRNSDDVARGKAFADTADMLLFDAKAPSSPLPGGNGISFDWTLLRGKDFMTTWFLSGGLNMGNIEDALSVSGAMAVDLSSSLESEPGIKDPELIRLFLKKVKNYER